MRGPVGAAYHLLEPPSLLPCLSVHSSVGNLTDMLEHPESLSGEASDGIAEKAVGSAGPQSPQVPSGEKAGGRGAAGPDALTRGLGSPLSPMPQQEESCPLGSHSGMYLLWQFSCLGCTCAWSWCYSTSSRASC